MIFPKLEKSWHEHLKNEFKMPYMLNLESFLQREYEQNKIIYPHPHDLFQALNLTPFHHVKVVILGQDPYHGEGQAHGPSFSVLKSCKIPPSLVNIFKELKSDLNIPIPQHGHLIKWAEEGVLLLNNVLTVEAHKPASHQNQGWEIFTEKIISLLNEEKEHLVFILWGAPAQKKGSLLDSKKHFIIKSPHPSPLSAYRGFFGSRPFSQTNNYLIKNGLKPIDWGIK